ncbi:MAG: hypothetical protein IH946_02155, partial [Bacteroidetes bacterium]|nr:hypothetical protein [Bacteroidota bacterium]
MRTKMILNLLLGFATCTVLNATTYTTLKSGNWSDVVDVWSTNGSTACSCSPGSGPNGDTMNINHNIIVSANLTLKGAASMNVASGSSLNGIGFDLTLINSAAMENDGLVDIDNMTLRNTAFLLNQMSINIGTNMTTRNTSLLRNEKLITVSGDLDITASSSVEGVGGGFDVSGDIDVASGNWINNDWCATGTSNVPLIAECCACVSSILPIELVSFNATTDGNDVLISWVTATEINNDGFVVERSSNGIDFNKLEIIAAQGSEFNGAEYQYKDEDPLSGTSFYRLKQLDNDGSEEIFEMVSVKIESALLLELNVYPNPSNGRNITVSVPDKLQG